METKGKDKDREEEGDGGCEATWMHLAQQEMAPDGAQDSIDPIGAAGVFRAQGRVGRGRSVGKQERVQPGQTREAIGPFNPITCFD